MGSKTELQSPAPALHAPRTPVGFGVANFLLALAYLGAARLGLSLTFVNASASPVWPPTGLAVAALLVLGYRVWPGVFVGAFAANVLNAGTVETSLAIAAGNTLEGLAGAYLVIHFCGGNKAFDRPATAFLFNMLAGLCATMISATIGVTTLAFAGFAPWSLYGAIWSTWWIGDAVGAIVVAPALILWASDPRPAAILRRPLEALLLLLALVGIGLTVFGPLGAIIFGDTAIVFVSIPLVVWAAFRFGQREAATATLLLSGIAVWGTVHGYGPYRNLPPNDAFLLLVSFMGVLNLMSIPVAAVVSQHRRVVEELQTTQAGLEQRVKDRTQLLSDSERRFSGFMTNLPALAWIKDGKGAYIFANPRFAATLDKQPEDLLGKTDLDLFPASVANEYRENDERVRVGGETLATVERQVVHGETRHSLVNKFAIAGSEGEASVAGVAIDITDRQRAEEQLQRSQYQLAEAQAVAQVGSWDWNLVTQQIAGSDEFCRLMGIKPEAFTPTLEGVLALVHPADRDAVRTAIMATLKTHLPFDVEYRVVRPDGKVRYVSGQGGVRLGPNAQPERVASTVQDVTERKRAERDRAESQARLIEFERLKQVNAFKTQFINTAAHELMTPLTPLRIAARMMAKHNNDPAQQKNLALLTRNLDRLQRLVQDLLDASKLDAAKLGIKKSDVDISRTASEVVELFKDTAQESGVVLQVRLDPHLLVQADPDRMVQIVQNLVSNAIKFSTVGGTVTVEARRGLGGSVQLEVKDTGVGIDPEFMPHMFTPFSRSHLKKDQIQAGTGLGLYITKGLVELHRGTIRCQSEGPGKGTTFTVTLPA